MPDPRYDEIVQSIGVNTSRAKTDDAQRLRCLKALESETPPRRAALYYMRRDRAMSQAEVLPFSNMLKSIGTTECDLDLILISPGGDGTAAETMLDLCRKYCKGALRVVVPLYAKSAATLMALGADWIVMGETSELGPIDAQVYVVQDNQEQQVSADHFLRARDAARTALKSTDAGEVQAAQIQLASISAAFLMHCEDLMNFSRKFAADQLRAHMFRVEHAAEAATWGPRIDAIVRNLTASSKHLLHGSMISANEIIGDDELKHLKVRNLANDDAYWLALNELLTRTEIVAHMNDVGRVLLTTNFQMFGT